MLEACIAPNRSQAQSVVRSTLRSHIGRVEIWASSLIGGGPIETAHLLDMNSVGVGDKLFAHFESNPNGTKYVQFRDADGTLLPFSPYYDFNSLTLERAFLRLRRGQRIVCEVTEIKAMTGTCAPASPDTTGPYTTLLPTRVLLNSTWNEPGRPYHSSSARLRCRFNWER